MGYAIGDLWTDSLNPMFYSDYQIFWHKHQQQPVFTEADWEEYEAAKKRSVEKKVNRSVASLGLRISGLKVAMPIIVDRLKKKK